MLEPTLGLDLILTVLLAVVWNTAGAMAAALARLGVGVTSRWRHRITQWLVIAGGVLSTGKVIMAAGYGAMGWQFVWDKWLVAIPIVALPGLIAVFFYLRQTRKKHGSRKAVAPAVVVAIQAAGVGSLISLYLIPFPLTVSYMATVIAAWVGLMIGVMLFVIRFPFRLRWGGLFLVCVVTIWLVLAHRSSIFPDSYGMVHHAGEADAHQHTVSVADLTGPQGVQPDKKFTLMAKPKEIRLASGQTIEAWLFNGEAPGPELRVTQGDLVEVTLKNELPDAGVTIHWHGVNVPNAEDGVAGVTQNAVRPGETYVYRFVAEDVGTYWYHSHQQTSIQTKKGLFGALIVEPSGVKEQGVMEKVIQTHTWIDRNGEQVTTLGLSDGLERDRIAAGTRVRLRLINTADYLQIFALTGVPFRVIAIDGTDLNEPGVLQDMRLPLAAGGRYVLEFTMPATPVELMMDIGKGVQNPGVLFHTDGIGEGQANTQRTAPVFNPADYGEPALTPFQAESEFTRHYKLYFDSIPGFFDGRFMNLWAINGKVAPHTPALTVREGDRVKLTFVNRSFDNHPMHLHGHHMLVLSRNGKPMTGSPWWTDTLNVAPGEWYEVGFNANNPGIWMDHCHNSDHAAIGMTMHLSYEGITTPFLAGEQTGNIPE